MSLKTNGVKSQNKTVIILNTLFDLQVYKMLLIRTIILIMTERKQDDQAKASSFSGVSALLKRSFFHDYAYCVEKGFLFIVHYNYSLVIWEASS